MSLSHIQPSQGFIADSYHFYNIARESYDNARQGYAIHRQNDALVAIIFAALSLEAFINELCVIAKQAKASGYSEKFLDQLINAIDESDVDNNSRPEDGKLPSFIINLNSLLHAFKLEIRSTSNAKKRTTKRTTQEKFLMASEALYKKFDKGNNLYQDFADLFRLRDCLLHFKPEDHIEIDEDNNWTYSPRKLIDKLRSKNIFIKSTLTKDIIVLVSTAAAKWACDTASAMVSAILDKIPNSEFRENNEVLNLYKDMFQPLETDEQQILEEEHRNRHDAVTQADELRTRLFKTYSEFPDCVESLREDRSR